jgi:hypothetical protein
MAGIITAATAASLGRLGLGCGAAGGVRAAKECRGLCGFPDGVSSDGARGCFPALAGRSA